MKKAIYTILFLIFVAHTISAQTTIANGNWSDPLTWGGIPPTGTGTVVINHVVTLDVDYAQVAGSITINASGAINGSTSLRYFALNFPSGTASLTNFGTFNVGRVPLYSGTVNNSGVFQNDSLFNNASLAINSGGVINATQFMNNTGATIINSGTITAYNFLNIATATNNGGINATYFHNSKTFTNASTGLITVEQGFRNSDSLASPAIFTNDGIMVDNNDWSNATNATIQGSGRFCVQNLSNNAGTMSGTFDFCDQSGGGVDLNTGTIAGTITTCQFPCNIGISELSKNLVLNIYPNPFSSFVTIQSNKTLVNASLIIYNGFGQAVKQINEFNGQQIMIQRGDLSSGLYFIRLIQDGKLLASVKIIIAD